MKLCCFIVTWLNYLSGISEAAENPYGEDDSKSPFPVQPPVKRSYAQNVTVWIKASGLQVQFSTLDPFSYSDINSRK